MSRCLAINHHGKATGGKRRYWRLEDIFPYLGRGLHLSPFFKLLNEDWWYVADSCLANLAITLYCQSRDISGLFNVRAGVLGESGKEYILSEAEEKSNRTYWVEKMCLSKLRSCDKFIFFLEIERKGEDDKAKTQKKKSLKRKYETDLKEMLLSGIKHDLTINVKHKKFYCHTSILSARSPVFSAMLEHEMKEKCTREVFITDSEPNTFEQFLLYLYTGSDEQLKINYCNTEDEEYVINLYKLGDKYCVEDLKYLCVEQLKTNITKENFIEFFLLSQQYSDSELSEATVKFFQQNSEDIIKDIDWDEFMKNNPDKTNMLIKAL